MAARRMFCATVIDSDKFIDMPRDAQGLYFHMGMRADDDGFIGNARALCRLLDFAPENIQILVDNGYLIAFESGVVVIRHWKMHNMIRKDRYRPTVFEKEKNMLTQDESMIYFSSADTMATKDRIGQDRIVQGISEGVKEEEVTATAGTGEASTASAPADPPSKAEVATSAGLPSGAIQPPPPRQISEGYRYPTREEVAGFAAAMGLQHVNIDHFFNYYSANGWRVASGLPVQWQYKLLDWDREDRQRAHAPPGGQSHGQSRGQACGQSRGQSPPSPPPSDSRGSFDTEDFFQAALKRTLDDFH